MLYEVITNYSPFVGDDYPNRVFWGDTHLHTGMSMDAGAFGARLTPEDAYRFARGEELTSSTGLQVKLSRPLDFLVVADHSDNIRITSYNVCYTKLLRVGSPIICFQDIFNCSSTVTDLGIKRTRCRETRK